MKLISRFILFTCIVCFAFLTCLSHTSKALAEQPFTDEEISMLRGLLNKEAERVAAQKTFTEEETSLIRILVNEEAEKTVAAQPFSEDETSTIRGFLSRLKDIEAGGFIESYYQLESVDPDEGAGNAIFTKIYEREENSFTLDKVEVWAGKESTEESPAGFFISAWFGEIAGRLSPDPVAPDTIGRADNDDFTVYQAYASWLAPIGKGLDIKFGRHVTWLGYEVEESHWNANWSRSLLFTFAEPGVHNGIILSYPVLDNLNVSAYINNGFGPVAGMFVDNNEAKSIGYQFAYDFNAPILGDSTLVVNGIHGAELQSNNHDKRHTWDIWYEFTIADRITSGTDFGFGTEQGTHYRDSHNAKWWGISQVFKTDLADWLELGVRGEYFWDKDGARNAGLFPSGDSGGISMAEITTTFTFKPAGDNYLVRLEPRWDKVTAADGDLSSMQFDDDDTRESSNLSIALAVTYEF